MSDKEYETAVELMLEKVALLDNTEDNVAVTVQLDKTNKLNTSFYERAINDIRLAHINIQLCDPTPATEYAGRARHVLH